MGMNSVPYDRPAWCHICGDKLFYLGEPEHKPEVSVTVAFSDHKEYLHMHVKCWNECKHYGHERTTKKTRKNAKAKKVKGRNP